MTKYLHDQPEQKFLWSQNDILDADLERQEYDRNFGDSVVYNSILDDEPAYHSLMNFPEEDDDALYSANENIFDDRETYKDADQDDLYYFI